MRKISVLLVILSFLFCGTGMDLPFLVNEQKLTPAVGFEYNWREMVPGRIGYKFNSDDTGFALGMGFTYQRYFIDYAFGLASKLENFHWVSLGVKF